MPRGSGPRQPRWAKQGFGVARPKPASRSAATIKAAANKPRSESRAKNLATASSTKSAKKQGGYNPIAPERVAEIIDRLDDTYPRATCALQHKSAWELLVATILSAQCTDVRVNIVTPEIFRKYPTPQHFAALQPEELEPDIRTTGFFRNKSKSIVGSAKKLVEE